MIKFETVQEFLARGGQIQKVPAKKRGSKTVEKTLSSKDIKALPKEVVVNFKLK